MFWPTMPDSPLDIVIAASSNTRDTWWSKYYTLELISKFTVAFLFCNLQSVKMATIISLEMLVIKFENQNIYVLSLHSQCGNPIDYGNEGKQPVKKCLECGAPVGGRHLRQKTTLK